ncbi:MAG: DUF4214 domain-containing protein [Actinomycetia bacterium]|nr:DUF4214 domain-containing protein [Actinomycetes bacterium]
MSACDRTPAHVISALSAPLPAAPLAVSRRNRPQAAALVTGATMAPTWLADAAGAATPVGPNDGILVLLTMSGGNDGLNTVIPIQNGIYYDRRRDLAIAASSAIPIGDERALHPGLSMVNHLWNKGDVAIIDGVGTPGMTDLSHFSTMARVMGGGGTGNSFHSGWLGRYLDGLPGGDDPFHGVNIGTSIPLVVQGQHRQASGLPPEPNGIFQIEGVDDTYRRQYDALAAFAATSTGLGDLADSLALNGHRAVDLAARVEPIYGEELPEGKLKAKLELAARLINANLGIRVLSVDFGDFDSHARQPELHNARMAELNEGLQAFYNRLHPSFGARTMILAMSEFGRRVKANNSSGTDHGAANTMLAIGSQIRGGFYGELPSLSALDRRGNLVPTVDLRSVYATILDDWLGGDSNQILGGTHENLDFAAAPSPTRTTSQINPITVNTVFKYRGQVVRLYRAYFGRLPDTAGFDHWVAARRSGMTLVEISDAFASATEFQAQYGHLTNRQFVDLIYHNVLGRGPDGTGLDYWSSQLDQGMPRGQVMIGFSESVEFIAGAAQIVDDVDHRGPVARLYQAYFERSADSDGLRYWIGTSLSYEAVSDAFAGSAEFQSRYGSLSDAQFIDLVYTNVLDRPSDGAGRQYWLARLAAGTSRGTVMLGFSDSAEFIAKTDTLA